jgi:hypothetical protein
MQYSFEKVKEKYPKTTLRSKRSLKKLHLAEFSETLVSIDFSAGLFDNPLEYELLDAMYEYDDNIFVSGSLTATNVMFQIKTSEFSENFIKEYCKGLLLILSEMEPNFAEIGKVTVVYGDAYYGEW